MNPIHLVAHRGLMQNYPENTLISLRKALDAGALFVEFDVHLSSDGVPVVLHDVDLLRTTGRSGLVFDYEASQLQQFSAGYPSCFGEQFIEQEIPTLEAAVTLLKKRPEASAFVELKCESLNHFGRKVVLDKVLAILKPVIRQAILISFDYDVMQLAKRQGVGRVGWVIGQWSSLSHKKAVQLQPDYLFADYDKEPLGSDPYWLGPWQWVVYDVVDPVVAAGLVAQGVMVESADIKSLIDADF